LETTEKSIIIVLQSEILMTLSKILLVSETLATEIP